MPDTGDVDQDTVIRVLKVHRFTVSKQEDINLNDMFSISKGDVSLSMRLPPRVKRRLLHFLSRRFGVPIHHFYHPEMAVFDSLGSPATSKELQ